MNSCCALRFAIEQNNKKKTCNCLLPRQFIIIKRSLINDLNVFSKNFNEHSFGKKKKEKKKTKRKNNRRRRRKIENGRTGEKRVNYPSDGISLIISVLFTDVNNTTQIKSIKNFARYSRMHVYIGIRTRVVWD